MGAALQIPGYEIERRLGEGNMATVYLARGITDERKIVLKTIPLTAEIDREAIQRFMQEYKIIARIQHRNVIHLEERGFASDLAFIAMEYCSFGTLKERIRQGLELPEALYYLKQIAAGLGAVHDIGVAHRDLKPTNILFRQPRTLVLADFGVAKDLAHSDTLTQQGAFVGSLYYVSPEQISCQTSGPLSDLYSVGVMLFQMLTGKPPYLGKTAGDVMDAHLHAPIPKLPSPLRDAQPLIDGLLAKDPCDRFQSIKELSAGIEWTQTRAS
jgi:serine/threonine-protein kinase PpkA